MGVEPRVMSLAFAKRQVATAIPANKLTSLGLTNEHIISHLFNMYATINLIKTVFTLTMEASIGRKRVVVAVLLEHSVNAATSIVIRMVMAYGGMLCSGMRLSPSHRESPDFLIQGGRTHISIKTFCLQTNVDFMIG